MQVMFPSQDDEENEQSKGVNVMDLSGIAVDISNMHDDSFVLHLDSVNNKLV